MVYRIYDWVKSVKPWVQVSSSPLGKYNRIERVPNAGWTAYESVFQDPKIWMQNGKQDMIVPMMYYLHDNFSRLSTIGSITATDAWWFPDWAHTGC